MWNNLHLVTLKPFTERIIESIISILNQQTNGKQNANQIHNDENLQVR